MQQKRLQHVQANGHAKSSSKQEEPWQCVVIEPEAEHVGSVIFMHGMGETAERCGSFLSYHISPHVLDMLNFPAVGAMHAPKLDVVTWSLMRLIYLLQSQDILQPLLFEIAGTCSPQS